MKAVIYGQPAHEALADVVARLGSRRVLIMASSTLNRETDEVKKLQTALGSQFAGVFDRITAHVPRKDVITATRVAKEIDADLIVTIGGGSPTDAAKAVSLCLDNGIDRPEGIDRLLTKFDANGAALPPVSKAPTLPQISIPTTLSAGEFSAITGVTNEKTGLKDILKHPGMMPSMAILDAAVARHTPEWLFLSTGIRAIDHCVEGICSQAANPLGDAQALRGLELLAKGLAAVKAQPNDSTARLDCLLGAWLSMGPLVSGVPMGASHGIGYVLCAQFGILHGHTSCLMLPSVMAWNASVNGDRQRLVSTAFGDARKDASVLLGELISGLGVPRGLLANGITADDFDEITRTAMLTPWLPENPRQINGPDEVQEILALAQ